MGNEIKNKIFYFAIGFLIIFYLFWPNYGENKIFPQGSNILADSFSNIKELHWTKMPITYEMFDEGNCNQIQVNHFREGLEIITNLTERLVIFAEVTGNSDLKVTCINPEQIQADLQKWREENKICKNATIIDNPKTIKWYEGHLDENIERFFSARVLDEEGSIKIWELCYTSESKDSGFYHDSKVLGEGGPSEILGNKIIKGEIKLYQEGDGSTRCTYPTKEIHELLHSFGFGHVEEPYFDPYWGYVDWGPAKDILFPHLYCNYQNELNEKYVSCLKYIYSNGEFGFCGGDVNFMDFVSECPLGLYPAKDSEYCCPEPNMKIVGGYCHY
jgi:hypothetical protein